MIARRATVKSTYIKLMLTKKFEAAINVKHSFPGSNVLADTLSRTQIREHDAYDERLTMAAWEGFVTGAATEPNSVSKIVLSSWQRSQRLNVEPLSRSAPMPVRGEVFEKLRNSNSDMIWAAQGLFGASAHLLAESGSIMLLTDPNGVVLDVVGDVGTKATASEVHLVAGASWHESTVGTNGIGTALAMRQPVQVHGAEHFCEGIKSWTCAAAPVYMPGSERILGVIDISGPPSTYQRSNLALALSAARQIEAVLAERCSRDHVHLLETSLKYHGHGDVADIFVFDCHGNLIHSSGKMSFLLMQLGSCLPGMAPGLPADEFGKHLPEGLRSEWLHPVHSEGRMIGALVLVPSRIRVLKPFAQSVSQGCVRPHAGSSFQKPGPAFESLVGQSIALIGAIDRARHLRGRRVGVLIHGETGVGKELFARAIHGDEESSGPFLSFNCGATTKELIGSELFGYVRGAFTGATNEGRAGRFELAHGGTLCLDEIGELPLDLQPVLLRALEDGVVTRLGEAKSRRVDVRLLAMTNRDLLKEVEAGRFRRDLYHRISVTTIRVPPLRDRAGDIDLLTHHFGAVLAQRHGVPSRIFSEEVLRVLRGYSWPGNVRELRNAVESLLLTSDEETVSVNELPPEMSCGPADMALGRTGHSGSSLVDGFDSASGKRLGQIEQHAIVCAIHDSNGNLTRAARVLGVSRSTLYRKVERYHLEGIVKTEEISTPRSS